MTRKLAALKLKKSPLVFVLAQVRFTPIPAIEEKIGKFQESFLQNGYLRFEEKIQQNISIITPEFQSNSSKFWIFGNRENTRAIVLSKDFLVLQTTAYDRFEPFVEEMQAVLKQLAVLSPPGLVVRIGLRYVDAFKLGDGEKLDEYLQAGLAGYKNIELQAIEYFHQSLVHGKTTDGEFILRVNQNKSGLSLPGDLAQHPLKPSHTFKMGDAVTILDFDHFNLIERDFDISEIISTFWKMHQHIDAMFKDSIKPYALEQWGAENV
jgi:uncharacterized protein (TIGR04255 family)